MGQSASSSLSPEVLQSRINDSNSLLQTRANIKKVYCSMVSRVLHRVSADPVDLASLPDASIFCILEFLAGDLSKLLSVSASWHFRITEVLDRAFNLIESQFALIHSHLFVFKTSFQSSSKIEITNRAGFRIDRVLIMEPLPILACHTIKLRYLYKISRSLQVYKAEFKLDCVKKGRRLVWSYKDTSREVSEARAYSQQIPAVCVGDNIEIAVNWFSLVGLVRLESIRWQPPLIQDTRAIQRVLSSVPDEVPRNEYDPQQKKAYLYKVSRQCELETPEIEWYDSKYYSPPQKAARLDCFQPFLRLVKFEYAGSDVVMAKNTYVAEKVGIVPDAREKCGVGVEIREKFVRQEVKRMGLLYDRHRPVHLRVGDTFVLYISC
jgi:hypothetical protein